MSRGNPVPITPEVLTWAILESGFSSAEISKRLEVPFPTLRAWQTGEEEPKLTQFRKLAGLLRRPEAVFFLPEPPPSSIPTVEFRHPVGPGSESREHLSPEERRWLREAHRLQKAASWLGKQLDRPMPVVRLANLGEDPEKVAAVVRDQLQITFEDQVCWKNVSEAQRSWRNRLEEVGILVFFLPLGKESCRGFSVWDPGVPLIAVNTAWNQEARIFTLFHELGHLLTRTDSACLGTWRQLLPQKGDHAERWCEQFAAAVLLPWPDLADFLGREIGWRPGKKIEKLAVVGRVARKLKTSVRATTLRLIAHEVSSWDLYRAIPAVIDNKKGGGGGHGRDRNEIRRDQYGERTINLFREAIDREVLSRDDVLSYLDIPDTDL